jgi:DNA polymerase I
VSIPKLLLIDGHSLAFRSYYAFAKGREGGLRTSTGIPTSVCFGFMKSFLDVVKAEKPDYLAIAFDLGGPTYRHDADPEYKAGRSETPEDFIPDLANLQELLTALNLKIVVEPGYEADDVIGTLARRAAAQGWRVKVLSGDRDLFQLVDDQGKIQIMYLSSAYGQGNRNAVAGSFGPEEVKAKIGVRPDQVVDYKALCGDSSDNIPGVKGVGHKTAVNLLKEFDTLENLYKSLDQVKGALKTKLEMGYDLAVHSQFLAQIHLDVPIQYQLEEFEVKGFEQSKLLPVLEKLELQSFIDQMAKLATDLGGISMAEAGDDWFFSAEDTAAAKDSEAPILEPIIVQTCEQLNELVAILKKQVDPHNPVAWDTETTSLSPRDAKLVGIGCCWGSEISAIAYIPIGHKEGEQLDLGTVIGALKPILEDAAYPKALQNAKFDRQVLKFQGMNLQGVVFDTLLASYVLNPEDKHNLSALSETYLGIRAKSYADLVPKGQTMDDIAIEETAQYCGLDAYTTYQLVAVFQAKLADADELRSLFTDVELPLEAVLSEMETWGIRIDQGYLAILSKQLGEDLARIETAAYDLAGEKFNLGSPKQLSTLLFETLGLDTKKTSKTKTGYSTNAAVLERLQGDHPIIDLILQNRTLAKLKSTYVDALPALVRKDTGRVHTDFNQAVTATGRLSSSNPNLQNIPIRTEFSRQIRKAFIPQNGWQLAAADYSQIELRILAHLSQEERLVDAFQSQKDIHALTAQLLLECDEVTSEERRLGKIINFGVIYGMGPHRFAREAGVSYGDAKTFIERFYERYPGVFDYLQRMEIQAVSQGYVSTLMGRRRYFDFESRSLKDLKGRSPDELEGIDLNNLKISNYERGQLRAAANAPIQGSSADLIKKAMVELHNKLNQNQAHMLIQVHDELIFEVDPSAQETILPLIQTTMESAMELNVPLLAEVHTGKNWMEAK